MQTTKLSGKKDTLHTKHDKTLCDHYNLHAALTSPKHKKYYGILVK